MINLKKRLSNFGKNLIKVLVIVSWIGIIKFVIATCMFVWVFALAFLNNQGIDITDMSRLVSLMFKLQLIYIVILVTYYIARPAILKIKKLRKER